MDPRVKRTIVATTLAAASIVVILFFRYPPTLDAESFLAFGTLLAIKWPRGEGRTDRRQVPLDDVLDQLLFVQGIGMEEDAVEPTQIGQHVLQCDACCQGLMEDADDRLLDRVLPVSRHDRQRRRHDGSA